MLDCQSNETEPKPKRRKSNTATWKAAERAIAALLGGERIPVTGRTSGERADINHAEYALEVKHGKQVPALLVKALSQAVKAAKFYLDKGEGERIPIVVLHPEGARYDESLLVIQLKDLERLRSSGRQDLRPDEAADPGYPQPPG
jgi:hypothetical protein